MAARRSKTVGRAVQTGRQRRDRSGRRISGRFQMNRTVRQNRKPVVSRATKQALSPGSGRRKVGVMEDHFGF